MAEGMPDVEAGFISVFREGMTFCIGFFGITTSSAPFPFPFPFPFPL